MMLALVQVVMIRDNDVGRGGDVDVTDARVVLD